MEKSKRKMWLMIVPALLMLILVPIILAGCGGSKTNLKLTTPFNKTEYYLGEELDVNGGVLTYTDENGEESVVIVEESFVTGFDTSTSGRKTMTIIYENKTVSVSYVVKNFRLGEYRATQVLDSDGTPSGGEIPETTLTFNANGNFVYRIPEGSQNGNFEVDVNGKIEFTANASEMTLTAYYDNDCIYLDMYGDGSSTLVLEYVA